MIYFLTSFCKTPFSVLIRKCIMSTSVSGFTVDRLSLVLLLT